MTLGKFNLLKGLLLAVLGFVLPIIFGLLLAPFLFEESFAREFSPLHKYLGLTSSRGEQNTKAPAQGPVALALFEKGAHAEVVSNRALDPRSDQTFLLSFWVRFERDPEVGQRQNIIAKYHSEKYPYAGWAFAVNRLSTSLRPQVYWKGRDGSGGWFTFGEAEMRSGSWYAFYLLAKPGEFISLFLKPLGQNISGEQGVDLDLKEVEFLGGHELKVDAVPLTDSSLILGTKRKGGNSFSGRIANILLANTSDQLPKDVADLKAVLAQSVTTLARRFGDQQIALWIAGEGKDRSRFGHAVRLQNGAKWHEQP